MSRITQTGPTPPTFLQTKRCLCPAVKTPHRHSAMANWKNGSSLTLRWITLEPTLLFPCPWGHTFLSFSGLYDVYSDCVFTCGLDTSVIQSQIIIFFNLKKKMLLWQLLSLQNLPAGRQRKSQVNTFDVHVLYVYSQRLCTCFLGLWAQSGEVHTGRSDLRHAGRCCFCHHQGKIKL